MKNKEKINDAISEVEWLNVPEPERQKFSLIITTLELLYRAQEICSSTESSRYTSNLITFLIIVPLMLFEVPFDMLLVTVMLLQMGFWLFDKWLVSLSAKHAEEMETRAVQFLERKIAKYPVEETSRQEIL